MSYYTQLNSSCYRFCFLCTFKNIFQSWISKAFSWFFSWKFYILKYYCVFSTILSIWNIYLWIFLVVHCPSMFCYIHMIHSIFSNSKWCCVFYATIDVFDASKKPGFMFIHCILWSASYSFISRRFYFIYSLRITT